MSYLCNCNVIRSTAVHIAFLEKKLGHLSNQMKLDDHPMGFVLYLKLPCDGIHVENGAFEGRQIKVLSLIDALGGAL